MSCDTQAHPSAAQPAPLGFNGVMTGVITIVNHLPALSSFPRYSAMWQLHAHPKPAHTSPGLMDHPASLPKALGFGHAQCSGALRGTGTSPTPQHSEGPSTFPTGLIYGTRAGRILKGNTGHITICSQSMAPYCHSINLDTSAWHSKCSTEERPRRRFPAFL